MGLMFDDSNELVCPECGGLYFVERVEYMLDKNITPLDTTYIEKIHLSKNILKK